MSGYPTEHWNTNYPAEPGHSPVDETLPDGVVSGQISPRPLNDNDFEVVRTFLDYAANTGTTLQLAVLIAKDLLAGNVDVDNLSSSVFENLGETAREILSGAINSLCQVSDRTGVVLAVSLDQVVANAPALELIVRYARDLSPAVLPYAYLPSEELVQVLLAHYHQKMSTRA